MNKQNVTSHNSVFDGKGIINDETIPSESTVTWEEWEATQAELALTSSMAAAAEVEEEENKNSLQPPVIDIWSECSDVRVHGKGYVGGVGGD